MDGFQVRIFLADKKVKSHVLERKAPRGSSKRFGSLSDYGSFKDVLLGNGLQDSAASNDNEAPVRAIESSRWDLQNTISRGAYSSNQMVQSCTSRKGLHEVQIVSANTIPLGCSAYIDKATEKLLIGVSWESTLMHQTRSWYLDCQMLSVGKPLNSRGVCS
ncbi:hypothetical protein V6N11_083884 [Hibiscus sabdariffa]|uniref:Uncharacterized protein n=1 Tax=Hibiscus sabdariffa TaxID=183260 RepID=A0ABR2QCU4_9ROSI